MTGKPGRGKVPPEQFVYAILMFVAPENWPRTHFPINRTRIAYAVCTFWEGGLRKPSFTANSIKALGALLIGRLYFWLSSSLVLLPLSKGSAANVKLCDNRAIRHSTEFDPATSLHDGCLMISSPAALQDALSTTHMRTPNRSLALLLSLSRSASLPPSLPICVPLQIDPARLYAVYLKPPP